MINKWAVTCFEALSIPRKRICLYHRMKENLHVITRLNEDNTMINPLSSVNRTNNEPSQKYEQDTTQNCELSKTFILLGTD